MNFAIVLPNLSIVKPIEQNEWDVEGEASMGVDVLQELAIEPPNGLALRSTSSPSGDPFRDSSSGGTGETHIILAPILANLHPL